MLNVLIIACSGVFNRGTEALVRGVATILKNAYGEEISITFASKDPAAAKKENIKGIDNYIYRLSKASFLSKVNRRLFKEFFPIKAPYSELINSVKNQDVVLVIGADNYDRAYNMFNTMHFLNKKIKEACKGNIVLYNCSLNKESIDDNFIREVEYFDATTIRESQTWEYLKPYDLSKLHYFPDPAFVMQAEEIQLPSFWKQGKMLGVNLSTLIVSSAYGESLKDKVLDAYRFMINQTLNTTDFDVVFIPHVMMGKDLYILKELYTYYESNRRVHLIDDEGLTAPQLKYIISQLECFVGARTHATIAAYSSCVPTLVLGYSVKSIGIAKDLFGSSKGYVLPVQQLTNKEQLWNDFNVLLSKRDAIKKRLQELMPSYKAKAFEFAGLVNQFVSHE